MITTADLKAQTRRELADLAKNYGISGWHGMRKHELVKAIEKMQRSLRRSGNGSKTKSESRSAKSMAPNRTKSTTAKAKSTSKKRRTGTQGRVAEMKPPRVSPKTARIRAQIRKRRESVQRNRDLSTGTLVGGAALKNGAQRTRGDEPHQDRVVLLVRDAFWLQASWEITRASVQRAQSALAERWHTAVPTLRLLTVGDVSSNRAESIERDIQIHGGVNTWYIDVDEPPSRFRVMVGYLADNGEFFSLCRSNIVETPKPGECERLDEHWSDIAEDYERIYSLSGGYDTDGGDLREMFEERLQRTMPQRGENGLTAEPTLLRENRLPFKVDAEMIVFGSTSPTASVMIGGNPVKLQADGSFTVRLKMPDKRQVLPVTAESRDGSRQRTTVIAVERNTKTMETVDFEDKI
ncbi:MULTISPECIES: DUF4912 domain-containing protein [Crateriforma]|uniref:Rho termination factor-like N-terminal domain-containing protein n=1 Tax=Crateriforma conspicua TaxID=2527996 RepID=A0A5C6FT40_9PLAN|nr:MULTISPECIES: DUF4912 domain-containing protein [Crateriforma]TWU65531.1 hypothetical protein V7x_10790 [Crateriforma conspicua]